MGKKDNNGVINLRDGIVKLAAKDFANAYIKFINEPCKDTFRKIEVFINYFDNACDGILDYDTSKVIKERIFTRIESRYPSDIILNLRSKYKY